MKNLCFQKEKYKKQGIFNGIYIEFSQIILGTIFLKCMHCWLKLTKEIWNLMLLKRCPCEYLNCLYKKWKNGESSVHPKIWPWHLNDWFRCEKKLFHPVLAVLADFAVCDWWHFCKALCDIKFSQIEGNGLNLRHIKLSNSVIR